VLRTVTRGCIQRGTVAFKCASKTTVTEVLCVWAIIWRGEITLYFFQLDNFLCDLFIFGFSICYDVCKRVDYIGGHMKKLLAIVICFGLSAHSLLAQTALHRLKSGFQKASQFLSRWPKRVVRAVKKKYIDKVPLTAAEEALLVNVSIGAVTTITAALVAVGGYVASRPSDKTELKITASSGTTATNVGEVLEKYKVRLGQDDSLPALFVKAVTNGANWMVKDLVELVPVNVLQAGQEIAGERTQSQPTIYNPIKEEVTNAITQFDADRLKNNLAFIRNALSELIKEVQKTICLVSSSAINEAIAQLERKKNKRSADLKMMEVLKAGCIQ